MPGRNLPEKAFDERLCKRCQLVEPSIVVRNESLCKDCFKKYVQTKVIKRMESFRVRNDGQGSGVQRKLLLPLTFDAASLALLHILSQHLRGQKERTGRPGYKLLILCIHEESSKDDHDDGGLLSTLAARYPDHDYRSVSVTEALAMQDMGDLVRATSNAQSLLHVLGSAAMSATSRQDLKQILFRRLVVSQARDHYCEAVLWSDTTTKLAERTLAETAKGRGFALPWIVADGESPFGVPFYYPLREVMNKEVDMYLSHINPALVELRATKDRPAVSTRNTTIDDLMSQYFESVEQEYPSIVANVVRTTGKLQPPSLIEVEQQCELCNMPLAGISPAMSRLCYGCIRTLPQGR